MKKYVVELTADEREQLHKLISAGSASARMLNRARILLKADDVGKRSEGGRVAPRAADSPDARDLHGHGAARAGAFLQAGSSGGA